MKLDNLRDLLVEQVKDLYSAENQIIQALPKMAEKASEPKLKQAFELHLEQTREQAKRLEQVAEMLGAKPGGKHCKGMEGLIAEGKEMLKEDADPPVMDAGLIAAAQHVEHYEMAGYGCARTYAKLLDENEAARLLQTTLDEEGDTDYKLTALAEGIVNPKAEVA